MNPWSPDVEEELALVLKDWLKQQGRTQADLRRSLRATSTRMPALMEVLETRASPRRATPSRCEALQHRSRLDQQCPSPCQRLRRRLNNRHGSIWPTRSPSARNPRRSRQLSAITGKVALDAFLPCVYPLPSSSASDSWLVLVSVLLRPRSRRLKQKHGCLDPTAVQGQAALWCQLIA